MSVKTYEPRFATYANTARVWSRRLEAVMTQRFRTTSYVDLFSQHQGHATVSRLPTPTSDLRQRQTLDQAIRKTGSKACRFHARQDHLPFRAEHKANSRRAECGSDETACRCRSLS